MKIVNLEETISEAKKLAEKKLAIGENADEFVEIGEADGFKLYVIAGKTLKDEVPISFHENPRDVFMLVLKGEIEFTFENKKNDSKSQSMFCSAKTLEASLCFQGDDNSDRRSVRERILNSQK